MSKRNRVLCLVLTSALLALSGCATQRADVRVDKADTDLGKCRTFDWRPVSTDAASFTDQRVRAAALKRLEEKGYTLATEKPDCQITYVLSTQDQPKPKPSVGVGVGGGSGGARGGIGVSLPIVHARHRRRYPERADLERLRRRRHPGPRDQRRGSGRGGPGHPRGVPGPRFEMM